MEPGNSKFDGLILVHYHYLFFDGHMGGIGGYDMVKHYVYSISDTAIFDSICADSFIDMYLCICNYTYIFIYIM